MRIQKQNGQNLSKRIRPRFLGEIARSVFKVVLLEDLVESALPCAGDEPKHGDCEGDELAEPK